MRRTTVIGLLLGGLLLSACRNSSGGPSGGAPPDSPPPPDATPPSGGLPQTPPTATLSVSDPSGAAGPFQIQELEKLIVGLDCAHLRPGPHDLRVAITSPGGAVYAQFPAKVLVGDDGTARASTDLQVRGSTIESYNQAGTWQLVAMVDGVQLAAASIDLSQ